VGAGRAPAVTGGASAASARRARLLLAAVPLSAGAALVVHILARLSLALAVAAVLGFTIAVAALVWRRLPADRREEARRRALVGLAVGLLSTAAYDVSRLLVVTVFPMTFWPFGAIPLFGAALLGDTAPEPLTLIAGLAFHLANGVGFGAAYVLVVRRPRILTGLAWAAILETAMVGLYPGWLDIKAMDEFLSVSIVGHAAYGATLGGVSAWALRRRRSRSARPSRAGPE
jgi:hypothetical protein